MAQSAYQISLDDLGIPLVDVEFVVVDLETTGGSPAEAGITEIGAVRVRAGEVLAEFHSLVNPGRHVPAFIAALTGITDAMLASAPRIDAVLPAFLEFARGSVLVAHNAPFDVGFLRAASEAVGTPWPGFTVIDTVRVARVALHRDEVRNVKLSTLAARFGSRITPSHRALDDARATVDVLHGLLERAGSMGVRTLDDLTMFTSRVTAAQRRKRSLADGLPDAPGVYVFEDAQGRALYVGTSRCLRRRVRSYFTSSEQRARISEMIAIAERVTPIVCATALEAQVRELRLIVERQPRYNRRSRHPERAVWVKLTQEPFPRASIVREVKDDGAPYAGPFAGRSAAEQALEALHEAVPLRTCSPRISLTRNPAPGAGCMLADLGRCLAPCRDPAVHGAYQDLVERARDAMTADVREVESSVHRRLDDLVAAERFEDAAAWRDRLNGWVSGVTRTQRISMLASAEEVVAARPTPENGWEIHVMRHGRLAAAGISAPGTDPGPVVEALIATAEHVEPGVAPAPAGLVDETRLLLAWLDLPGVRLVRSPPLCLPLHGGGSAEQRLSRVHLAARLSHGDVAERPPAHRGR